MNKKKLVTIIVAVILVVAIILGGVWFFFLRGDKPTKNEPKEKIDLLRLTIPEETLINTDFSDFDTGVLPEGWDKTHPYLFLNDADKSTCLETTSGNKSHVSVKHLGEEGYISFGGRDGEHILTSAPTGSENYMVTAKVVFTAFRTPFGIALDIPDDYKSANRATLLTVSAEDVDTNPDDDVYVYVPTFKLSHRVKGSDDFTGEDKNLTSLKIADVDRSAVSLTNKETGEGTITPDLELIFKAAHYEGVSYFFINDKLIGTLDDYDDTAATRFGFFSDLEGREVKIKELRVDTLTLGETAVSNTEILATGTDESLLGATELPEGFKLYSGQWLDKSTMGTAEATADGVKLTSDKGATALMLPSQKTRNLIFTAKFSGIGQGGSFGLVTSVASPLSGSRGGSFFTVSADLSTASVYNKTVNLESDLRKYNLSDIKELNLGDSVELSIYNFDGFGYCYINGVYFTHIELFPGGSETVFCGIYTEGNSSVTVESVKTEYLIEKGVCRWLKAPSAEFITKTAPAISIKTDFSKNNIFAKTKPDATIGILVAPSGEEPADLKIDSKELIKLPELKTENGSATVTVSTSLPLTKENISSYYTLRSYATDGEKYYYGESVVYTPAPEASAVYLKLSSKDKAVYDTLFEGIKGYVGKYEKTITFALFSDFHYKAGMYSTSVADMQAILDRAHKAGASFILSGGDFCNDFKGSPELMNAFLKNNYNLPAYNVYGNHELEAGNSMDFVTPLLTNDKNVVWGTEDGKIGDGSIAYYYADRDDFRIVCIDTNYSFNPNTQEWEHNYTGSYGPPTGNTKGNSLGPVQLQWLEEVLTDAAYKGKSCIVIGHDSFSGKFRSISPDAARVREIYSTVNGIREGTVLISINGHIHTDNMAVVGNVLYIDMNTTRNGVWRGTGTEHYGAEHTYDYVEYDEQGNAITSYKRSLNELTMGKNTWFFEDPLSAIVKVSQYGTISVEGMKSRWIYGINPADAKNDEVPKVTSGKWELIKK